MFFSSGGFRTPKILVAAPTNNAINVIENKLLQRILVWNKELSAFVRIYPYYQRLSWENKTVEDNPLIADIERQSRKLYPESVNQRLPNWITLVTLGSVYRAFPRKQDDLLHRAFRNYDYVFIDEVSQVSHDDLFCFLIILHISTTKTSTDGLELYSSATHISSRVVTQ